MELFLSFSFFQITPWSVAMKFIIILNLLFRYILQYHDASPMEMDTEKLVEYNPQLKRMSPTARIAYAKFKMNLIKQEFEGLRDFSVDSDLFDAGKN